MKKTDLNKAIVITAAAMLSAFVCIEPALAADAPASADWVQPATGLLSTLENGLVKFGSIAVGIGVIVVGLIACVTSRMNWDKFAHVVIGGVLIMAGPAALRALLQAAQ